MKTKYFIIFIIFFAQCQNKKIENENIELKTAKKMDTNILKQQILSGQSITEVGLDPMSNYNYQINDYNIIGDEIKTSLVNHGYKIDSRKFAESIYTIFGIKSSENITSILLDYKCPPDKPVFYTSEDGSGIMSSYKPLQIDFNRNILIEAFYVPEIIDYKKKYPELLKEEELILDKFSKDGTEYLINKWMNDKNLPQQRQKNIQTMVSRNKYLFNDDKASFAWLKFNDKNFLRSLVLNFGYTKDKDLLKWVMESIKLEINLQENNAEEFGKLLWHKDCSGRLKIHNETFELIHENNKKELPKYEDDLLEYIFSLNDEKQKVSTELSFAEKAKITAYCLHFMQKESARITDYMGEFAKFSDQDDSFSKEFEKNNFYNIPNFKEEWKEAKEEGDGIWYPGMDGAYNEPEKSETHPTAQLLYSRPDFQSYAQEITTKGEIEYLHKISGWDFVKIGAVTGYLATEEAQKEKEKIEKKKNSFLADEGEEIKEEPKKKGFFGGLFG